MKILIVDDEARALKRLVRLTHSILGDKIESVETGSSLSIALEQIEKGKIDLLLLDLNLNGRDGFEVLKSLVAQSFQTIIVSAYHDRAIEAFEYGVLDFVPKPVAESRLKKAFERFETRNGPRERQLKYLSVKRQRRLDLIPIENILYFSGANDYTEIHIKTGKTYLYEKSLDSIELLLKSDFIRIHRSFIVRSDSIASIQTAQGSRYSIEMKNGSTLPIGRTKIDSVRQRLLRKTEME